jgi:hypothetical protein
MKRSSYALLTVVALSLVGANFNLITQVQALVGGGLDTLGLEWVAPKNNVVGGPQTYAVTDATIKKLQGIKKSGKHIVVDNDGTITIK